MSVEFDKRPPYMPPHKGACTISHNQHLNYYRTVAQDEEDNAEWYKGSWVSEESRAYAIANNELWSLQWYPETPVGFCNLCAGRWEDIVSYLEADSKADAEKTLMLASIPKFTGKLYEQL